MAAVAEKRAVATRGPRLYELADEYLALMDRVDEFGGEVLPEIEARLDEIGGDFNHKAGQLAIVIRQAKMMAELAKAEKQRLAKVQQTNEDMIERLEKYLADNMDRLAITRIETPTHKIRIQDNPPSIAWEGRPEDIPEPYRITEINYKLDRTRAHQDRKEGYELPEGFKVWRGRSVRIG